MLVVKTVVNLHMAFFSLSVTIMYISSKQRMYQVCWPAMAEMTAVLTADMCVG